MRGRMVFACVLVALGAFVAGTAALAAPAGEPGKPDEPGKASQAPGHNKAEATDSKHDPSNPDGTYRGKSPSTPDQDGIGADHGIANNDKTGPGTDGNNGCGNDPDREDDNNGWCGAQPTPGGSPTPEVSPTGTPDDEQTPEVLPTTIAPSPQAEVLGRKIVKPEVAGRSLATTGAGLALPVGAASALLVMGLGIRALSNKPRI